MREEGSPLERNFAVIHRRGGFGGGTASPFFAGAPCRSAYQEIAPAAGDQEDLGREPVAVLAVLAPLAGLQLAET